MRGFLLTLVFAAVVTVGSVLLPAAADAQPDQPAASDTVVVVSDVDSDATENAKARARAYEAARARGFAARGKLDVNAAASRAGALEAGTITTDETKLGELRTALGVTLLVRISREWEKTSTIGVRVTLVSEQGVQSRVVEAPKANPGEPVQATLADLLGAVSSPPPPKEEEPPPAEPQKSWTVLHEGAESPKWAEPTAADDPKVRRRKWEERGGAKLALDARLNVTLLGQFGVDFTETEPNPETMMIESGSADRLGIGGGVGVRLALMYLPLPDPATQSGFFAAFRLGVGADPGLAWISNPVGFTYSGIVGTGINSEVEREDVGAFVLQAPVQVGIHFGLGNYRTADQWRGLVLGLTYSPTFIYIVEIGGEGRSDNLFNYGGAEVSLDVTKLTLNDNELGTDPHVRMAVSFLPPIDDDFPMVLNATLGAAWY